MPKQKNQDSKDQEKTPKITSKKPKSNKIIITIVAVVSAIVIVGVGIFFVFKDKKAVTENIKSNYSIYKIENEKAITFLEKNLEGSEEVPSNQFSASLSVADFETKSSQVDSYITSFSETKNNITPGPNKYTEEVYNKMNESLDKNIEVMKLAKTVFDFRACTDDKTMVFYEISSDMSLKQSLMQYATFDSIVGSLKDIEGYLQDAIENTENFRGCFEGDKEIFNSEEVQVEIDKMETVFKDLFSAMIELRQAVEAKDSNKINTAGQKLDSLGDGFDSSSNEDFLKGYEDYVNNKVKTLTDEADSLTDAVMDSINKAQQRFRIDSSEIE